VIVGVDHVQVAAPPGCEADARRFFGDVLGLTEIEKPAALRGRGGVWFAAGGQQLHVGVDEGFAPALRAHPALAVAAGRLEVVAERLVTAGVDVHWDEGLPGVRRFYAEDPWGNRLELLEPAAAGG
jgi:catechol 2,3-dioxygenase-like lactoylglutathione lyase family enzyme